jgi:ElaA protein
MANIEWHCKPFSELRNDQLYELIKLRIDIFVVEQTCPYTELDDKDRDNQTHHLMAYEAGTLLAYARLLPPGLSYSNSSIGRFAVLLARRKQGIGTQLMQQCITNIAKLWPKTAISISAQQQLQNFYQDFGFEKESDVYHEDGIPHIDMLLVKDIH